MLILDKVEGLGFIAITLGTLGIGLGAPRRRLSAWFERRAGQSGAWRYDAVIKKAGAVLLLAGFGAYWIDSYVIDQFLLPSVREIVSIASGDGSFLDDPANYPDWLQIALASLGIWPLVAAAGVVVLAAGSQTLRGSFGQLAAISRRGRGAEGGNRG